MWTEEARIRFYFATTLRRATNLIQMTIQKIGSSDPSFNNVTAIMDKRSGLREAYNDMEDEIDEFINFDDKFVKHPRLYNKLITLALTMGDSVDKALSMLPEYLSNISDVDDIFQDSMMTCLELSVQLTNLANRTRELLQNEARDLIDMRKRLERTLARMEGHWEHLLQEAQKPNKTVVFSELENLVQMARFATEQIPPHRETNRISEESPDIVATHEPDHSDDSAPESDGDKNEVFHNQGAVAMTDSGTQAPRKTRNPDQNRTMTGCTPEPSGTSNAAHDRGRPPHTRAKGT